MSSNNGITVEAQLYGNGTIWIASVSSWSGKDKLRAEDLGKSPSDILDIIELGRKKITPDDVRISFTKPQGQIAALMSSLGKRFFIRGAWFVPNNHFMMAKTGMEKIRDNQAEIVEDLIANFPEIKAQMIENYPILEHAEWPSEKTIRSRFGIKWHVCEIRGAEVNEADAAELAEAKREFKEQLKQSYEDYRDQIMEGAKVAMFDSIQEISEKIETGQKITEGSLKRPRRLIDDYLNIAQIFDLEDVKGEVEQLRTKLENTDARDIRTDWNYAKDFAGTLRSMAADIGDLSGLSSDGTIKRVVKKGV